MLEHEEEREEKEGAGRKEQHRKKESVRERKSNPAEAGLRATGERRATVGGMGSLRRSMLAETQQALASGYRVLVIFFSSLSLQKDRGAISADVK